MAKESQIKAPNDFKILIVYPNLPLMLTPSLAVGLFTSIFKKKGYQVQLFETTHYSSEEQASPLNRVKNLNVRPFDVKKDLGKVLSQGHMFEDFRELVLEYQPDVLIFSLVEDPLPQAIELLRVVEDLKIPHLVGGVFPSTAPDICMEMPEINLIGLGEGERTVATVAEAVRTGQSLAGIPGTWFKKHDGEIIKTRPGPLVNINDVLPDFSLFDRNRFSRPIGGRVFMAMPVETYRGCPYSCTYCNSPAQRVFSKENDLGVFLRRKKMSVLRDELAQYLELYDPEFCFFIDDSFLARPRQEIFDFCDMYEEFKLPFWFNTRAENCSEEVMKRLAEVGCYRISFGIEAGNEEYRSEVLRRKVSNKKYLEHFKIIADSGIAFSLNVIIGMPGETRDLVMDTVELIRSIEGFDALTVNIFTPYHGTVLRTVAVNNGWLDPKSTTQNLTAKSLLNMPPPYLSSDDIDGLVAVFPLYCYFPKSEWDKIRRAETPDEEGMKLRDYYGEIYLREFLGETQDKRREPLVEGGTGCRTNPKDSFRHSPKRIDDEQLAMLTIRN
ncbi:MAG: radical SAM protein [SAR324 cluster bacterium]|nr:radical SAM protein [SAR324 cluster bacterium]